MNARKLVAEIPTETLLAMVALLTNGKADPQFVRAIAMEIKRRAHEIAPGELMPTMELFSAPISAEKST